MNTMAWIAIAAIIVASINSWLQFLLKERSEKKKALATANPATNQPSITDADRKALLLIFKPKRWLLYLAEFAAGTAAMQILLSLWLGLIPTNLSSGLALFWASCAVVLIYIITWTAPLKPKTRV
jgi:hypothetical protein